MKQLFLTLLFFPFLWLYSCRSDQKGSENISFYEVPLVCGTAPEIGCGSRIKPLFIDTEKEKAIKESWANRKGTAIAIVWNGKDNSQNQELAQKLFAKHEIEADLITGNGRNEILADFNGGGKWYKGMVVDELSVEEAGVIANEATSFAIKGNYINTSQATTIRQELEDYFKRELVQVRSYGNLVSDSTQDKWKNYAYSVFVRQIGERQAGKLSLAYDEYRYNQECKESACD